MAVLPFVLIALGTLAFGAVYPWAYLPLLAAAATLGLAGLWRNGLPVGMRPLAYALGALCAAAALQLVPLPDALLATVSPATLEALPAFSLTFTGQGGQWVAATVDPQSTRVAWIALVALSLYLLGLPALLDVRGVRTLPRLLALFAVPLALYAIYTRQYHNAGLLYGFWRSIDGGGPDQAGPFVNRNHFAGWMLMTTCLMIGWLFGQAERIISKQTDRRRRTIIRLLSEEGGSVLLMTIAVALAAVSIFWVVSRSAIMSFGVAAALFGWLALGRRRFGHGHRLAVLATLGGVLLGGIAWRGLDVLVRWFLDERSLLSRMDAWRDAWSVVRDFPLVGTGLNTYSRAMLLYQERNPGFHMAQAHNDYLQLLAEGGLLVAIPAAVAAFFLARAVRRTVRAARNEARGYWIRAGAGIGLVAMALQETVEFSLQIPANALLFCTLAAVAVTPVRTHAAGSTPRGNIERGKGLSGGALP